MCFSTDKLKFIDMVNFLAPGYSYDKYLKAYGCNLQKGHFPYDYMDDVRKLDDCVLPQQAVFYSRLKNEGISDEDYALCQAVWHDNRMTTLRQFLVWYNNRDVVPFLEAIGKQFAFYIAIPVQRPSAEYVLHRLQSDEQRPARTRQR